MRAFSLPGSYRLVMLPYRVLQELATPTEKIQCLSCVRDHLEEGGLVLIDNYNPSIPTLARDPAASARHGEDRSGRRDHPADRPGRVP
jgi:hypothetical protein